MQRLLRKFETAKSLVPAPVITQGDQGRRKSGVIYFGSTGAAMAESLAALELDGIHLDQLRLRGFPFARRASPTSSPRTTACSSSSRTATRR